MSQLERAARALVVADEEFGFDLRLTRLVDGESTYTLTYFDGTPPLEFTDNDAAYRHIARTRAALRTRAVIASIEVDDAMVEAGLGAWDAAASGSFDSIVKAIQSAGIRALLAEGEGR